MQRCNLTSESAIAPLNHESARLTRKVQRWTTRRGGHISAESKTRGAASAQNKNRRNPIPSGGEVRKSCRSAVKKCCKMSIELHVTRICFDTTENEPSKRIFLYFEILDFKVKLKCIEIYSGSYLTACLHLVLLVELSLDAQAHLLMPGPLHHLTAFLYPR